MGKKQIIKQLDRNDLVSERERLILELKCLCLMNNSDYEKGAQKFRKYIISNPKEKDRIYKSLKWEAFKDKYGVMYPLPSSELGKLLRKKKWGFLRECFKEMLHKNIDLINKTETDVTVRINLRGNKKKISNEINALLLTLNKRIPPEDDLDVYKRCIGTYQLKKNEGLTSEQLAKKRYPNVFKNKDQYGKESAIPQVKREIRKAKWLIEKEGYKYLR